MLSSNTEKVMSSAPTHARLTQFSNGLNANWKMATGRFAIGAFMSADQNWLFNAVKSSGAVSPLIRATASITPVITPPLTARSATMRTTFHCGAPNAAAASLSVEGTKFNMLSVVRTTTGIAMSANATDPAQPEKCFALATITAYTNSPKIIEGADNKISLTKRVVGPTQPRLPNS